MKHLFVMAFLSSVLLLNTPDPDGTDPGDQTGDQQPTEPTLEDQDSALVAELEETVALPTGLLHRMDSGEVATTEDLVADSAWARVKAFAPDLASRIEDIAAQRSAEREEREAVKKEADTREDEAHELNVLPDNERADRIQAGVEEQVDQEVEEIVAAAKALTKMPHPEFEKGYEALMERIGPAMDLADIMAAPIVSGPFIQVAKTTNPAERLDRWEKADARTRALASRLFGVRGPTRVDVGSSEYQEKVSTAAKESAANSAWIRDQLSELDRRRNR